MITEQSISINEVKFTLVWMGESPLKSIRCLSCIQTQQLIKPRFDRVIAAIPNRLLKLNLRECSTIGRLIGRLLMENALLVLLT